MAEEAISLAVVGAPKAVEESTRPIESADGAAPAEAKPVGNGDVAPADTPVEEQASATAASTGDQAAKNELTDANPDTVAENGEDIAPAAETNGTPASKKANNTRRKSAGSVPEHKAKKTPSKKKKAPELHLNTQPGDMWMVAMRGYQPWPVIICDEEMLPGTLLAKRPVSAKRIDGTYRDDYQEGGKNAKDRRYPVMFLGTNEFAWQVNYELLPFDQEEVKKEVVDNNRGKKSNALWEAYVIAAEGHDLAYFKNLLALHDQAMQEDAVARSQKEEEKARKAEKAAKRKSTAAEESDDVEMEDAGDDAAPSAKKAKASKKRKTRDESDGEPEKTPRQKLKLNNKPKDASSAKPKKESKPKKGKASEDEVETAPAEEPPMTEEERLQKREKSVLYLRHRLQKGFLSRDQVPRDEDMPSMAGYLKQLEEFQDLESEVVKNTKVHKVLKAILKLNNIPREEEFNFKKRSGNLLTKWNTLATDADTADASASAPAPATNGVKHEKKANAPAPENADESSAAPEAAKPTSGEGDTAVSVKDDAPAVEADAGNSAKVPTPAAEATAA